MNEMESEEFWEKHAFVRMRGRLRISTEPSEVILENKIFMGNIRSQDDIYEGHPRFASPTPVDRAEIYELTRKQMRGASQEQVEAQVDLIMERLADESIRERMLEQITSTLEAEYSASSILCFFRSISSQRNWAQYAEQGRGHAFVFDFRTPWRLQCGMGMDPIEIVPFPVEYVPEDQIPEIPIKFGPHDPEDGWSDIRTVLLMKSDKWSDQKEERLFRVGINEGFVEFPEQSLRAVVLGYDAPADDEALILDLCAQRKEGLAVYRMHADRQGKRLTVELVRGVAPK